MHIHLDPQAPDPPFEQIRRQVAEAAADGSIPPGHRLPTVRGLATELGVAANTVAKAYRALESDGVIETRGRLGTVVSEAHATEADRAAHAFVERSHALGLSLDEAISLVQREWL